MAQAFEERKKGLMIPSNSFKKVIKLFKHNKGGKEEKVKVVAEENSSSSEFTLESLLSSSSLSFRTKKEDFKVRDIHELRDAIINKNYKFEQLEIVRKNTTAGVNKSDAICELLNHDVINLIAKRYKSGSKPGNRDTSDNEKLALCIEGGGMRGCVPAGMVAAIACLGLSDTFDVVYGSSAGSIIGAYMISRQLCTDIYADILPVSETHFISQKRIILSAFRELRSFLSININTNNNNNKGKNIKPKKNNNTKQQPGMNLSFILDRIMDPTNGIRPLDIEMFKINNTKQPLKVVSSCVDEQGKICSKTFGTDDYFGINCAQKQQEQQGSVLSPSSFIPRSGLFACLEGGMSIPGATGPPIPLQVNKSTATLPFFDAFCTEPLPYRSAVYEGGATHALVLCSRSEGFKAKTKPGIFEKFISQMYFKSRNLHDTAKYFLDGGQLYVYLEDLLTLEEGKNHKKQQEVELCSTFTSTLCTDLGMESSLSSSLVSSPTTVIKNSNDEKSEIEDSDDRKVLIPPPELYYGMQLSKEQQHQRYNKNEGRKCSDKDRKWKKAHLLPLQVPEHAKEVELGEKDPKIILNGMREGFAAAFDLLAPTVGFDSNLQRENSNNSNTITGIEVARLIFPDTAPVDDQDSENKIILNQTIRIQGEMIGDDHHDTRSNYNEAKKQQQEQNGSSSDNTRARQILLRLPGLEGGKKFRHLANLDLYENGDERK